MTTYFIDYIQNGTVQRKEIEHDSMEHALLCFSVDHPDAHVRGIGEVGVDDERPAPADERYTDT